MPERIHYHLTPEARSTSTPVVLPARKHPILITAILAMNPWMTLYQNPSDSQVQERRAAERARIRALLVALSARARLTSSQEDKRMLCEDLGREE